MGYFESVDAQKEAPDGQDHGRREPEPGLSAGPEQSAQRACQAGDGPEGQDHARCGHAHGQDDARPDRAHQTPYALPGRRGIHRGGRGVMFREFGLSGHGYLAWLGLGRTAAYLPSCENAGHGVHGGSGRFDASASGPVRRERRNFSREAATGHLQGKIRTWPRLSLPRAGKLFPETGIIARPKERDGFRRIGRQSGNLPG